jgi:MFS family permease
MYHSIVKYFAVMPCTSPTENFWLLSVAFFLGVLAINGTIVHIVALLTDRGVPLQVATGALSVAGTAIIVGRIICGWCLDRFWGPYVAVCFFVLPMLGIALLGSGWGFPVPLVGAALCGAGIGAEIDLMAFFISRYFGLKAYGRIYGLMFMLFNIGTGMGPVIKIAHSPRSKPGHVALVQQSHASAGPR